MFVFQSHHLDGMFSQFHTPNSFYWLIPNMHFRNCPCTQLTRKAYLWKEGWGHYCRMRKKDYQCCQLSRMIRETPDFGPYLLVSGLESDSSRIIAKVAISCRLDFQTIKFQIFCVVWATVNMEHFLLINWTVYTCDLRRSKSKSIFGTNDVICRAIWRHLSLYPHQFSIFDDVGGWQPGVLGLYLYKN